MLENIHKRELADSLRTVGIHQEFELNTEAEKAYGLSQLVRGVLHCRELFQCARPRVPGAGGALWLRVFDGHGGTNVRLQEVPVKGSDNIRLGAALREVRVDPSVLVSALARDPEGLRALQDWAASQHGGHGES